MTLFIYFLESYFVRNQLSVLPNLFGQVGCDSAVQIRFLFQDNLMMDLAGFLRKKSLSPRMREELSDILDIMRSIKLVS
jgi:hypothetical protein